MLDYSDSFDLSTSFPECMTPSKTDLEDPWVEAAIDCLECQPKATDKLDACFSECTTMTKKLRMYQSIEDYYSEELEPLWCNKFTDLHITIYNLIMKDSLGDAVLALQLSMILLSRTTAEELKRLLRFMKLAAVDTSIQLSSKVRQIYSFINFFALLFQFAI